MRIAIDAMGGDHAPHSIVEGALKAAAHRPDVEIVLVGPTEKIKPLLSSQPENISIRHTEDVIAADEEPVRAVRRKKDSSMVVACSMVRDGTADAVICAGNTGAFMTAGLLITGRIPEVERPALAPIIPNLTGKGTLLLDAGANMDAKPEHLLHYALMGSIYAEQVMQISKPRVGLLNVGTEENKGNELTKETFHLLKEQKNIHFIGNIEARDILFGICDVTVCDGFSGNILLKSLEGMAEALFKLLREEFTRDLASKLAAAVLKPRLRHLKEKLDYSEYGGAPLLGLKGACIKAHGSSNVRAIENAIYQAIRFVEHGVNEKISREIKIGERI